MGGNAVHTGHNSGHKSGTSVFMLLLVFQILYVSLGYYYFIDFSC